MFIISGLPLPVVFAYKDINFFGYKLAYIENYTNCDVLHPVLRVRMA